MYLYLTLLLVSFIVPFVMSFEKNLQFYKQWKHLFPSILIVAFVYIVFDIYYTKIGIWGFNSSYHLPIKIFGLPLEEILFFILIPYACIFIHDTIIFYSPELKLNEKITKFISAGLIVLCLFTGISFFDRAYTLFVSIATFLFVLFSMFSVSRVFNRFYITYLFISVPFLIINGILTGAFIENEVVWYNNQENLGIRIFTIPIEDFAYGFSLILGILLLREKFQKIY